MVTTGSATVSGHGRPTEPGFAVAFADVVVAEAFAVELHLEGVANGAARHELAQAQGTAQAGHATAAVGAADAVAVVQIGRLEHVLAGRGATRAAAVEGLGLYHGGPVGQEYGRGHVGGVAQVARISGEITGNGNILGDGLAAVGAAAASALIVPACVVHDDWGLGGIWLEDDDVLVDGHPHARGGRNAGRHQLGVGAQRKIPDRVPGEGPLLGVAGGGETPGCVGLAGGAGQEDDRADDEEHRRHSDRCQRTWPPYSLLRKHLLSSQVVG